MKLSEVIQELEQDAEAREHQANEGSPVTSMSEDFAEGAIAHNIREIIQKLKQVTFL